MYFALFFCQLIKVESIFKIVKINLRGEGREFFKLRVASIRVPVFKRLCASMVFIEGKPYNGLFEILMP